MKCQFCDENKAIKEVNYMTKEEPQYAWSCEECNPEDAKEDGGEK